MIMSTKEICKRGLSMTISLTLGNTPLPLADGLGADAQQFRRLTLGPAPLQAQAPEQRPGVLVMHLFSPLPQDTRNSAGTQATLR